MLNEGDIQRFVSDTATDLTKYGLDRPNLKIVFSSYSSENTAEANAGETVLTTLAFGNSDGGFTYARVEQEPYIFSITDKFINDLPTSELNFRTLDILELRRDELESVHVDKPGQDPIDLVRGDKGQWVIKGKVNQQNEAKIQTFLNTLASLRATAWMESSKWEQSVDRPSLIVQIRYQSGETDRELELKFGGANPENKHYGTSTEQTGTFLLDNEQFGRLNASLVR
jgi:hypothetical protein